MLLLLVGVSLLSIATIFFLVYAFLTYGLITRSIIIGAITIAAFVVTGLLRRRGLAATAEGIGTFAVVLIYLDAFAVRANDLLALGVGARHDVLGHHLRRLGGGVHRLAPPHRTAIGEHRRRSPRSRRASASSWRG